jgi:RND family efflux transporter MFP subunit
MKRILLFIVLTLLAGVIGWNLYQHYLVGSSRAAWKRRVPQVAVEIAPVRRAVIRDIGQFTGSLRPNSRIVIAPKIAGRLEKLLVDIGDTVQSNQLIAVLDGEEYKQQLIQVKAQLEVTKANLEANASALAIAKRELERVRALHKKRLVSASDLDTSMSQYNNLQSKLKVAKAQLAEKQAAIEVSSIRLSYTRVSVPAATPDAKLVVGERFVDNGSLLTPNAAIVSIIDISKLTAIINVTERDYFKLKINQPAEIAIDTYTGKTFPGRIVRIAPLIKETSREAQVEIEVPNRDGLMKPGMFVKASILFQEQKQALVVPAAAVVDRKNQKGVFLADLEKNNVQFVALVLGIAENDLVEVVQPIITGQVVTLGHHLLQDGSAIKIPGRQPKSAKKGPQSGPAKAARKSKRP